MHPGIPVLRPMMPTTSCLFPTSIMSSRVGLHSDHLIRDRCTQSVPYGQLPTRKLAVAVCTLLLVTIYRNTLSTSTADTQVASRKLFYPSSAILLREIRPA